METLVSSLPIGNSGIHELIDRNIQVVSYYGFVCSAEVHWGRGGGVIFSPHTIALAYLWNWAHSNYVDIKFPQGEKLGDGNVKQLGVWLAPICFPNPGN